MALTFRFLGVCVVLANVLPKTFSTDATKSSVAIKNYNHDRNNYNKSNTGNLNANWKKFCSSSLEEQPFEVALELEGKLPAWITGAFLKNSAGRFEIGGRSLGNVQDGYAKVYRWRFDGGRDKVWFNTRFLQTETLKASINKGEISPVMFLGKTTPSWSLTETKQVLTTHLNNPNVALWNVNPASPRGGWIALAETFPHFAFDANTLESIGPVNHTDGLIKNNTSISPMSPPHPHRAPGNSNDTISFVIMPNPAAIVDPFAHHTLTVFRMNSSSYRHAIATIDIPKVHYIHSFSVTQTKVIIFAYPFHYRFIDAPLGAYVENFMKWDKSASTTIYVVDLETGKVEQQSTDSQFCFHHVNAWDIDDGGWEVDAVCYSPDQAQTIFSKWDVTHSAPPTEIGSQLRRFTFTSSTTKERQHPFPVVWKVLSATQFDLPQINNNMYRNSSYCNVYGWNGVGLFRVDICKNTTTPWQVATPNQYPSEPIFVSRPKETGVLATGDDGVVVAVVFDGNVNQSSVVILDPDTMAVIANATSPVFTPFSIHGAWDDGAT